MSNKAFFKKVFHSHDAALNYLFDFPVLDITEEWYAIPPGATMYPVSIAYTGDIQAQSFNGVQLHIKTVQRSKRVWFTQPADIAIVGPLVYDALYSRIGDKMKSIDWVVVRLPFDKNYTDDRAYPYIDLEAGFLVSQSELFPTTLAKIAAYHMQQISHNPHMKF